MFSHSNTPNYDLNGMVTGMITGVVSTVLTGMLSHYVVQPVVQKGVDKIVPPEPLVEIVDIDDAEVIDAEENADDTE